METIKLKFSRPVDKEIGIIPDGGEFGSQRSYGSHIGVDFSARLKDVYAVEDGRVAYCGTREGSESRPNYGNVIVIDHDPDAGEDQRHIYSLYAHLDSISVSRGGEVGKECFIGIAGNTGTKQHYEGERKKIKKQEQRGYHLHFEIIDAENGFDWSGGWPGDLSPEDRRDPMKDYIGQKVIIEYESSKEKMDKIQDSLEIEPFIDLEQGICRFDLYLDGNKIGTFDEQNSEVEVSLAETDLKTTENP